jgi:hypothetical protein
MDQETLRELIRQPEGLRIEFKSEFYHLELHDPEARTRQWGELSKDVLALANGNVNIAGETRHIICGVGDTINEDQTRQVIDVGKVNITREQLLDKVNSLSSPPLPDLECDLLLLDGQRVFVISIPPTPHIHETTKRIITSKGQSFPEHTVFIRRGEGIHVASIAEIQTISTEKQRISREGLPSQATASRQDRERRPSVFDTTVLFVCILVGSIMGYWSYVADIEPDGILGGILGFMLGFFLGFILAMIMKAIHWVIAQRPSTKRHQIVVLWLPIVGCSVFGLVSGETTADALLGMLVGGVAFGLPIGILFAGIIWLLDWAIGKARS